MKKVFLGILVAGALAACNSNSAQTTTKASNSDTSASPAVAKNVPTGDLPVIKFEAKATILVKLKRANLSITILNLPIQVSRL
jgi:hypothetical protein